MAEKFFDDDIIRSGFEQPCSKGMPQVMEVEFMHPCPFNRFEPPMLEGIRVLSPPKEMSIEEATISNMWEIAAIVELLEQKGLCTRYKQDLHTIIDELRRKDPRASIPETAFPEPYLPH